MAEFAVHLATRRELDGIVSSGTRRILRALRARDEDMARRHDADRRRHRRRIREWQVEVLMVSRERVPRWIEIAERNPPGHRVEADRRRSESDPSRRPDVA